MKIKTTRWAIQCKSNGTLAHYDGQWLKKPNSKLLVYPTRYDANTQALLGERVVPVKVEMEVGE